ncbi:hypothetical protein AgCh_030136 [Apium graveolens]
MALAGIIMMWRDEIIPDEEIITVFAELICDPRGNIRASYLDSHRNMRDIEEWRMLARLNPSTRSSFDIGSYIASESTKYRPPGLAQADLDHLHIEVFTTTEKGDEENISNASLECSFCLEIFLEGAELVCFPCGHKYH